MAMRQLNFSFIQNYKHEFGGNLQVGKRKSQRPLSTKVPLHLVLRSSDYKIFNPREKMIHDLIASECKRYGIKLYSFSPNWTHMHLLIKIPSRETYNKFIRSFTAKLALKISKALGKAISGLFDLRPYTKILSWGRQFKKALQYQVLNQAEAKYGRAYREHVKTIYKYENMTYESIGKL
jgi:REP element-mobilizing transposase RayT